MQGVNALVVHALLLHFTLLIAPVSVVAHNMSAKHHRTLSRLSLAHLCFAHEHRKDFRSGETASEASDRLVLGTGQAAAVHIAVIVSSSREHASSSFHFPGS